MAGDALVVDASVITKWIVPEVDHEFAEMVYRSKARLLAPAHWHDEVANALWKKHRLRGDISREDAEAGYRRLPRLRVVTQRSAAFQDNAFAIALDTRITVYDALYVALAQEQACQLVTADDRLIERLGAAFAETVVRLRDFTPPV